MSVIKEDLKSLEELFIASMKNIGLIKVNLDLTIQGMEMMNKFLERFVVSIESAAELLEMDLQDEINKEKK